MKKKLMMGALLFGAITLASCVDDNESASVTAVRQAKAEYLSAQAVAAKTNADATLIRANADAALSAAQAEFQKAQAASTAVSTADREFSLQKAKDEYARELERIEAKAQEDLAKQQVALITAQQNLDAALKGEDAVKAKAISAAFGEYKKALNDLKELQQTLIADKAKLARVEAGLITAEASQKQTILTQEKAIAEYEAKLAVYQDPAYAGLAPEELKAEAAKKASELTMKTASFDGSDETKAYIAANNAWYDAVKALSEASEAVQTLNAASQNALTIDVIVAKFNEYIKYAETSPGAGDGIDVEKISAVSYNEFLNGNSWYETAATKIVGADYILNATIDKTAKYKLDKHYAGKVETAKNKLGVEKDSTNIADPEATAYGVLTWAKAQLAEATDTLAKNKKNYEAAVTAQKAAQKAYDDAVTAKTNLPATATAAEHTAANNAINDAQAVLQSGTKTDGTVITYEKSANGVLQTEGVSLKGTTFVMPDGSVPRKLADNSAPLYVNGTEAQISVVELQVIAAEDAVDAAKNDLANEEKAKAEYEKALAAFDVDAYNQLADAVDPAEKAAKDAAEAWEKAAEPLKAAQAEIDAITFKANNSTVDVTKQIADLEKSIATAKENIAKANQTPATQEAQVEATKADVENGEAAIAAQQKVVDAYKAAFDALVAEETAAE